MNFYDAAQRSRLHDYKRYVLDRYMEYVFDRVCEYTVLQCEKDYIAFRVFATAYSRLDDFENHRNIIEILDVIINRLGTKLQYYRPQFLRDSAGDLFDCAVSEIVLIYLSSCMDFLPHSKNWYKWELSLN